MTTNQTPDVNSALAGVINRSQWRQTLATEYEATAARLQTAYARVLPRLQDAAGAFTARVNEWVAANPDSTLTSEYVKGFKEYQDLLARVRFEMAAFSAIARNEASGLQESGVQTGIAGAQELFNAVGGAVVGTAWNSPDPAALAALIGYVDSEPFIARAGAFGENAANSLGDTILAFVAQGKNPRTIASILSKWFLLPYSWAENTARTVQLWSYRRATHESYRANANLLDGWVWIATLDARVCLSCLSQHGRKFSLDETLNDHHRGRCTPVPLVKGTSWHANMQTGADWFAAQSEGVQRELMGKGMYDLYTGGRFDWTKASRIYTDPVYGDMRRASTLGEMGG